MTWTTALVVVVVAAMVCLTVAIVAVAIAQQRTPAGLIDAHNTLAQRVTALEGHEQPGGASPSPFQPLGAVRQRPGTAGAGRAVSEATDITQQHPTIPRGTE